MRAHEGPHAPLLADRCRCCPACYMGSPPENLRRLVAQPVLALGCAAPTTHAPTPKMPPLCRFAAPLAQSHTAERLGRFEELLEAAVDMERVPDEYLISPTYDQVGRGCERGGSGVKGWVGG